MPFLKYKRLKLKSRVFLAVHSVAMVTNRATKIIPTCSPMIGQSFDTTRLSASTDEAVVVHYTCNDLSPWRCAGNCSDATGNLLTVRQLCSMGCLNPSIANSIQCPSVTIVRNSMGLEGSLKAGAAETGTCMNVKSCRRHVGTLIIVIR